MQQLNPAVGRSWTVAEYLWDLVGTCPFTTPPSCAVCRHQTQRHPAGYCRRLRACTPLTMPENATDECRVPTLLTVRTTHPLVWQWLLAAIAALAEFPQFIRGHLFVTKHIDPDGCYQVRLFNVCTGVFEVIMIDDRIPAMGGAPMFAKLSQQHEIWPMLLEKAVAKMAGSYCALHGNDPVLAFLLLTGCQNMSVFKREVVGGGWQEGVPLGIKNVSTRGIASFADLVQQGLLYYLNQRASSDEMFLHLKSCDQKDFVMSASAHDDSSWSGGPGFFGWKSDCGLVVNHAYSLVAVLEESGKRLLQLQNPHGEAGREWNGDWSDGSPLWHQHPELATACGAENRRDGTFWMCWDDFRSHFDVVSITNQSIGSMAAPKTAGAEEERHHPRVQSAPGGRSLLDHLLSPLYAVVRSLRNFDGLVVSACVAMMNVVAFVLSFIVGPTMAKLTTRLAGIPLIMTARLVLWTLLAGVARAVYLVYIGDIRSLDDAREDSGQVWALIQDIKPLVEAELDVDLETQFRAIRSITAKFLSDRWLLLPLCIGFRFVSVVGRTLVALAVATMKVAAFLLSFILGSTLAKLATRLAGWPLILAVRIAAYTLLAGLAHALWQVGVGDVRSVEDLWHDSLRAWQAVVALMQDMKPVLEAQLDVNLDGLMKPAHVLEAQFEVNLNGLEPDWSSVEQALQRVRTLEKPASGVVWPLLESLADRICPKPSYSDWVLGLVGLVPPAPPPAHAHLCKLWTATG